MNLTRETFAEIIIRDFATKYLDLYEPFNLEDVLIATSDPSLKIVPIMLEKEFYTLADVRFCMRILKLVNPFSHIRAEEYKEIDTREHIIHEDVNDNCISITLYDILGSLPADGNYLRRCPNCGKLFIAENKNRKYCYGFDKNGSPCHKIGTSTTRLHSGDNVEDRCMRLFSKFYKHNWYSYKKNKISEEVFEKWKLDARIKREETRNKKISYSDFELWLNNAQASLIINNNK